MASSSGKGPKCPSSLTGEAVVIESVTLSTILFRMRTAMQRPAKSSNFKMSLMSATTMPANLMAPMNLTETSPPSSTRVLQSILLSTR